MDLIILQEKFPKLFNELVREYNIQDTEGAFVISDTLVYRHNNSEYYLDEVNSQDVYSFRNDIVYSFTTSRAKHIITIEILEKQLFT